MKTDACIIADDSLPDGQMRGYTASGALIVEIVYVPVFKRLLGTSDDEAAVKLWRVCPAQAARIAAVGAWRQMGYICGGNA